MIVLLDLGYTGFSLVAPMSLSTGLEGCVVKDVYWE